MLGSRKRSDFVARRHQGEQWIRPQLAVREEHWTLTQDSGQNNIGSWGTLLSDDGVHGLHYLLLRELLARVDVGVLRALEGALQLLELLAAEGGPGAALLALQWDAGLRLGLRLLAAAWACNTSTIQT